MAKQLLIVADDFGACKEINDGIIKCAEAGSIDCVDAFVTFGEQSKQAIRDFQEQFAEQLANGSLRLGLHLTLTCGSPVATNLNPQFKKLIVYADSEKYRQLNLNGKFKVITDHEIDLLDEDFADEILKELQAQYDLFFEITGHYPYHISCHEGVFHLTEALSAIYFNWAFHKSVFTRNPCLISIQPGEWQEYTLMQQKAFTNAPKIAQEIGLRDAIKIRNWSKNRLPEYFNEWRQNNLKSTDYFLDHFYGKGSRNCLENICKQMVDKTYEMVVHPVWFLGDDPSDESMRIPGIDSSTFDIRKKETATLTNFDLKELLNQYSIVRIRL